MTSALDTVAPHGPDAGALPEERDAPVPATGATGAEASPGRLGLDALFTALFALVGWVVGSERLSDNSFFWHLRTGEWILDHGIPHHDVFSFTARGVDWVAQSWLAELTYGALARTTGVFGIRVLGGLVAASVAVLAYRLALRLCRSSVRAAGIAAAALAGPFTIWSERPLAMGLLLFVVLLWIVEVPDSVLGRHPLVAIPPVMWLWANVHGSFAVGFVYLGLHLVGRWVDGAPPWRDRERRIALAAAIGFALTFVNPYGPALVVFPVNLLSRGDILSHVIEWQSPDFRSSWGIALAIWICVFVAAVARGSHRVSRRDLVVAVPMLLLALWALRNVAVAPLVGLPIVARAFATDRERVERFHPMFLATATAAIVLVGVLVGVQAAAEPSFALDSYPVRSMRYVETHGLLGSRLLADDGDAGYVILHDAPRQRVFIDDRYDMYPPSVIYDYFALAEGKPGWERLLDRYRIDVVVWSRHATLAGELDSSADWLRVHRDRTHAVWVRAS